MAAAVMSLGAGLAVQGVGCGAGQTDRDSGTAEATEASARPALPALDLNAPAEFQTATFAYG
jgi:hypothetical protein